jgi:hypothetical protein
MSPYTLISNIAEDTRDKLVSLTSSSASGSRWDSESPANYLIDTTSDEIESSTRSILSSLDVTVEKTDEDMELSYVRSIRDHRLMISGERKRPSADFIVRGRRKLSQEVSLYNVGISKKITYVLYVLC